MNTTEQLRGLLDKPEWDDSECRIVLDYLENGSITELTILLRERFESAMGKAVPADEERAARILSAIHNRIEKPVAATVRFMHARKWYAAAAILILISSGSYLLFHRQPGIEQNLSQTERFKNDVAPGGNRAVLTLGNGQQIILDSAHTGTLAQQANADIIKTDSGKLAYHTTNEKQTEIIYNVLTTPRGGQYQLQLPDGSKVWLNAASSIKYPTAFAGKERTVEITGEAYFEVVHNAKMPFYVKAKNETIKDVGTHFNINAYDDEPTMKTTLLEGAIDVQGNILKPGQQAIAENNIIKIDNDVDIEQVIAWKNGLFQYNNASVQEVLRQMSRWYNVEVVYNNTPTAHLGGILGRNINLSEAIKMLQNNGIKCRIEENKLIVE